MRTMDANLTTAVSAKTRRPAITMTCEDHIQHYALYQSTPYNDSWIDAVIATDNSIVRTMIYRSGTGSIFAQSIFVQRITDPSVNAQWNTWLVLPSGANNMFQDGGVAIANNGGNLFVFGQQGSGGNAIYWWLSTNNGASWSGPGVVLSPPGGALIKGIGSAGTNDVFFLYDVAGGEAMGASFYSGTWSVLTTWTFPPITNGQGLAVANYNSNFVIIYTDGYSIFTANYFPSTNTWTTGTTIAPATSTAIARFSPRLTFADGLYTLTNIEHDTGAITGTIYGYPRLRSSADLIHWSNGLILHDVNPVTFGANYLKLPAPQTGGAGNRSYIATISAVYSAPNYTAAPNQLLDVSNSILSYQRLERQQKPATLEVVIDNAKGIYNALATSGVNYQPLGSNTTIVLSEGYKVGTPPTTNDVITTGRYHINYLGFERTADENHLRIIAHDISRNLDLVSRYQYTYVNQNVGYLVTEMCAKAGLFSVVLPNTAQTAQVIGTFVLQAGKTYRAALDELCATYDLDYFCDQAEVMQFKERSSSDPSVWSYQPEIELIGFVTNDLRANHIIVSGKPPTSGLTGALTEAEAYDDPNIHLVGLERVQHHTDYKLTSSAQCASKASFLLAQAARDVVQHIVTVPLNPALQLLDVVTLTDSAAPVGSGQTSLGRIISAHAIFEAQKGEYVLQLACEGV